MQPINRANVIFLKYFIGSLLFLLIGNDAFAQIVNIEDKRSELVDSVQWVEQLELGFNLTRNKTEVFNIRGKAQIEFTYFDKLLISITDFNFVKANNTNFVNEGFQHLRYNSKMNDWLTFELFGQVQYNERANIALRTLAGTGLRYQLFEKGKDRGFLGTSYMYEFEEESLEEIKHNNHRLSTYLSFSWHPQENIQVASTSYFQPLFTQWSDYRLSSQTSVIFSFSKRLDFRSTFSIVYDSRAALGAPKTIYRLLNSFRYRFR
ncbi:MAG: DUF481 domain-containing protein [Bacteroidota bacterium]